MKTGKMLTVVGLTSLVLVAGCGVQHVPLAHPPLAKATPTSVGVQSSTKTSGSGEMKVDVFGGSMAYGWVDPHNDSYLRRAFALRSQDTHIHYQYINHALPGFTAQWMNQKYAGRYTSLLTHDNPNIVVLSWGLENDLSSKHRDSVQTFGLQVKKEVATALKHHCVVLIVSPPVTKLLATTDHRRVERYINKEFQIGASFHNPNIVDVHLYQQMWMYMKTHHQTYKRYYGNAWHPNQAGHELAGRLLAADLNKRFSSHPILFRTQPKRL